MEKYPFIIPSALSYLQHCRSEFHNMRVVCENNVRKSSAQDRISNDIKFSNLIETVMLTVQSITRYIIYFQIVELIMCILQLFAGGKGSSCSHWLSTFLSWRCTL